MKKHILAIAMAMVSVASLSYGDVAQEKTSPVTTVTNDEGEHLIADFTGRTLYVFDLDQGRATPACSADCAEIWPPYLLQANEVAGLQAPLGSIVRANKKIQLTYGGRPVYTYAFDRTVADDKGDGIGGVWHYIELE